MYIDGTVTWREKNLNIEKKKYIETVVCEEVVALQCSSKGKKILEVFLIQI